MSSKNKRRDIRLPGEIKSVNVGGDDKSDTRKYGTGKGKSATIQKFA